MGGFHLLDLIPIIVIGLLIMGPKAFQSVARSAGKNLNKAKEAKDSILADLPIEEIAKITRDIPMTPQQAVLKILMPEPEQKKKTKVRKSPSAPEEAEDKEGVS